MPKLDFSAATFILNAGKRTFLVVNGYTLVDAAFIFAGSAWEEELAQGLKTAFVIRTMKLIAVCQKDENTIIPGTAMKAFDGVEFARYGEARLYEALPWLEKAPHRRRKELVQELRKTLSREGNRYLREMFIRNNEGEEL